jgi:transcriptional regulator with XRE-family HTH domain
VAEPSSLGLAIRHRREAKGLTQQELAERVGLEGMHKQSINRIELGKVAVSVPRLAQIATALDTTTVELLSDARMLDDLADARAGTEAMVVRELGSTYGSARLQTKLPPKAYERVWGYVQQLARAGLQGTELEEAEQFLMHGAFNKINSRDPGEKSDEDYILDIDAAWEFVRDIARRSGIKL